MGIAKEIFGMELFHHTDDCLVYQQTSARSECTCGADDMNKIIVMIDSYEISEEAIIDILKPIYLSETNVLPKYAAAIKANANKIFVRRGK